MKLATNGIVTDQFGKVLLILRDDTRTWALPGGSLDTDELPTDGVIREVFEETGIHTVPVRLVGLHYWTQRPEGFLIFTFRCLPNGGDLTPSDESPEVGYHLISPFPEPMMNFHRERVEEGYAHKGGPPQWGRQYPTRLQLILRRSVLPFFYLWKDVRRRWHGEPRYQPPPEWNTGAFVVIRDELGQVLWIKRNDIDAWNLPGGKGEGMEPPWETAVRETKEETGLNVQLDDLSGVYLKPSSDGFNPHMVFTFTGTIISGQLTLNEEAAEFAYFAPGDEPENSLHKHLERVADAVDPNRDKTLFRLQTFPADAKTQK
jgi:8-oxo-dGTP pyrophosphatase MutT (NUDIX family)